MPHNALMQPICEESYICMQLEKYSGTRKGICAASHWHITQTHTHDKAVNSQMQGLGDWLIFLADRCSLFTLSLLALRPGQPIRLGCVAS